MKQCFVPKKFTAEHREVIDHANRILANYARQGYSAMTLRQLYYQFVSRDLIPNTLNSYKRLASIINDARLAGEIDWDYLQDLTRNLRANSHWDSPASIMRSAAYSFKIDKWDRQEYRPEVWVEKEALLGVFEPMCQRLDVGLFACRGYTSQSEMYSAAKRFQRYIRNGQTPLVIHFGDHDPSGIDMTRDIRDRLEMFMGGVAVNRVALNMDQIEEYNPPPNPAKDTDARHAIYFEEFGDESWELDALEPNVIGNLIEEAVLRIRDPDLWGEAVEEEEEHIRLLETASDRWEEVARFLGAA